MDALMVGTTDREAAEHAGVSRQTVNKWKNSDPHFRAEMNQRRRELWYASKDKIRSLVPVAPRRLEAELQDGDGDWRAALEVVELVGETETGTLTGRRRMDVEWLTDRLSSPVQGTAADGLKLALALLWKRRGECPGATPVLACHDEVVVECDAEQAADAKAWLEGAMIEGMDTVLNGADEGHVPVEVEARVAISWGEGG